MKWIILVAIAITAASALPEKLHARAGRRGRQRQHFRQGRQEEAPANLYSVPEEEASPDTGYGAPVADDGAQPQYGAPAVEEEAPEEVIEEYVAEYDELPTNDLGTSYGAPETEEETSGDSLAPPEEYDDQETYEGDEQATYTEDQDVSASDESAVSDDAAVDPLAMLMKSVPGIPGEDYPIFAEAPETAFSCEGQVNGGMFCSYICFGKFKKVTKLIL